MKNSDATSSTAQFKICNIQITIGEFYNENASVIYTDDYGQQIDTFVIFDTDRETGLTHINHGNLLVPSGKLALHSKSISKYHLPIDDAFSFELLKKLKEKNSKQVNSAVETAVKVEIPMKMTWAKAS